MKSKSHLTGRSVDPNIRRASPEDFPAIFELLQQLWPNLSLDRTKMADAVAVGAKTQNQFHFCRVVDQRIVGFATLAVVYSLWQQAAIGYIGELVVNEADRGQGHGKALLDFLRDFAADRGCSRLELDSGFARTDAHAMYEHYGMTKRAFVFSRELVPTKQLPSSSATREQ
jgi:GNAT superfamily N-acetyltransferase